MRVLILFSLGLSLAACIPANGGKTLYVATASNSLIGDLGGILREEGLQVANGEATNDHGNTLRVIEAKNSYVRVWAQPMLMSGNENRSICGIHHEPYNDPGQYVLTIKSWSLIPSNTDVERLAVVIPAKLKMRGYSVGWHALTCSALAIAVD